ncbi:unnamed protein product [Didymodactylos carnosus]|uniref:Signal recognition particle subunit SRP54 n=1 Tax=Didymodactylos carnosus TaxID=1234261 RepID=A0A8S2GP14_9BILA|nr:unnamed protein product [Didymodactylos carnosus]CAF3540433.1 unnamed protein product [Didymodactylos carnosus]
MLRSMLGSIATKSLKKKLIGNTIDKNDITAALSAVRMSLIEGDVSFRVVKQIVADLETRLTGKYIDTGLDLESVFINELKAILTEVLGSKAKLLSSDLPSQRIMLVGLQGSGKTTTAGKIAVYIKNRQQRGVQLVALDIHRPAAIEQLVTLAIAQARDQQIPVTVLDTAGRLAIDEPLMEEAIKIKDACSPQEILLVVDAMSGQDVISVAQTFHDRLKLTGLIITKLDSDARGGAVLSLAYLLKLPILFTGTGEKPQDLDVFHPDRMADRILGLGDLVTLAEKAADVSDEKRAKSQFDRMMAGKFDLEDLMEQMAALANMGSVKSVAGMFPGAEKIKESDIDNLSKRIATWRVILSSMTRKERRNPKLLEKQPSRKIRVLKGSGRKPDEYAKMMSEFKKAKEKMEHIGRNLRSGKNLLAGIK